MRRSCAFFLICCLAGGCMQDAAALVGVAGWSRLKPRLPELRPDVVEMRYIFIERDAGAPLINEELWAEADEQAIPLEQRKLLNDNGLRIALLGGRLSTELLELLENANKAGQGRLFQTQSGSLVKIQTTDVLPECSLFTVIDEAPKGEVLENAQGYLHVTPSLGEDSTIHAAIVPEVEYGPRLNRRTPAPDLSTWQIRNDRAKRSFPELAVSIPAASGDFLLIGCMPDRRGTLGWRLFNHVTDGVQKQTVLLLRLIRPSRDELYTVGFDQDDFFAKPSTGVRRAARSPVRETILADRRR